MAETNNIQAPIVLNVPTSLKALVEALIFGAREPLSVRQIQVLYEGEGTGSGEQRKIGYEEINRSVEELNAEFEASDRPYRIIQIAGGYQFATLPLYAEWLGKLYKEQTRRKLSQSSIETLAIIAYKQPITKSEIESIRGVNCDYVLSTLLEKDLATIVGRAPTVGRPLLYGTSTEFLRHFGLNDLNDLPRPREIQEILGDSQFETERRMLEAQQGGEEKKEEEFKSRLPHIPKRKSNLDNEVKIVAKKRVRDIKVVPPAEEAKSGQTPEELPFVDAPPPVLLGDAIAEPDIVDSQSVPNEDVSASQIERVQADSGPNEEAPELPAGSFKSAYMPPRAEPVAAVEVSSDESTAIAPPGEDQLSGLDHPSAEEPIPIAPAEQNAGQEGVSQIILSEPDEVNETKINAVNELEALGKPIVEEGESVANAPEIENLQEVPHDVAATIEQQIDHVAPAMEQVTAEQPQDESDGPHPKTRWKSWKEKIQGFIKKLFG